VGRVLGWVWSSLAHTQNNGDSSSNRRHKGSNQEAQTSLALGPYSEHARQTIEKMHSAQKAMHDLSEQFRIHESEIQDIPKNQQKMAELEEECRNRDEIIQDHKGMNAILNVCKRRVINLFLDNSLIDK
jgi:hypothetical protein